MRGRGRRGRRVRFSARHIAGLFAFYAILGFGALTFALFYAFEVAELPLVAVLSLAFAAIATAVHVKSGRRDRVDELIDRGP